MNRTDEALREIGQAIVLKPQPVFFTNRASIAERAGQTDAALADLARALELDPDYARAYEDRADLYFNLDRPAAGLSDIERALAKPTAYRFRLKGRLLMHLARYDEAIPAFDASLDLQPANHVAPSDVFRRRRPPSTARCSSRPVAGLASGLTAYAGQRSTAAAWRAKGLATNPRLAIAPRPARCGRMPIWSPRAGAMRPRVQPAATNPAASAWPKSHAKARLAPDLLRPSI